jgi:HemY protein
MKYLIWLLVLFIIAAAFGTLAHNDAHVLLFYPPYRVQISLTLFVLLIAASIWVLANAARLLRVLISLPSNARAFRLQRTKNKRRALLDEVLNAYAERRYGAAEALALKAIERGDTSGLHPILAASAAHELNDFAKRDNYLAKLREPTQSTPAPTFTRSI